MFGFLGAIGLALFTDKRSYQVGDAPLYSLTGAIPGSRVAWSSFKNGQSTGEFQADYGQVIGANGTVELTGGAFADADVGNWQKIALIINPDGTTEQAQSSFSVSPKMAAGQASPMSGSGFFDGEVDLPVVGAVPKIAALAGAGIGLYLLFGKKGR